MPTPDQPKLNKPLGILPDGKQHVFGSGLFGGESIAPPQRPFSIQRPPGFDDWRIEHEAKQKAEGKKKKK